MISTIRDHDERRLNRPVHPNDQWCFDLLGFFFPNGDKLTFRRDILDGFECSDADRSSAIRMVDAYDIAVLAN